MKMSALALGVSADPFGLWGAPGPSEVRARLKEGGKLPQLQVRAVLALSKLLGAELQEQLSSFLSITGQNIKMKLN